MLTTTLYIGGAAIVSGIGYMVYRSNTAVPNPPPSLPVPAGKTRLCVTGYSSSPPTAHAHLLADLIARKHPERYETWYYFDTFACFKFMQARFDAVPFPPELKGHATSPFCWIETSPNEVVPIGGNDRFSEWAKANFAGEEEILAYANAAPSFGETFHGDKAPMTAAIA